MANAIKLSKIDKRQSEPESSAMIRDGKYDTFLNNLEKWVEAMMVQNNIDDDEQEERITR